MYFQYTVFQVKCGVYLTVIFVLPVEYALRTKCKLALGASVIIGGHSNCREMVSNMSVVNRFSIVVQ